MKFSSYLAVTVLALTLSACSNGSNNSAPPPPPKPATPAPSSIQSNQLAFPIVYQYWDWRTNCNTGVHQFNTQKEFCDALLNDSLNNNCAHDYRVEVNKVCVSTLNQPQITNQFTYEYFGNNCTTGRQQFPTQNALCDGLLNESLNKNCVKDLRVQAHKYLCENQQQASSGYTAHCTVNAIDLKDRSFLQNMNPFNPQQREVYRYILWDGKMEQPFGVFSSMSNSYGNVTYNMKPQEFGRSASGEISLRQNGGDDIFSAKSSLGSKINLVATNSEDEKEIETTCDSNKSFRPAKIDLHSVRCTTEVSEYGRKAKRTEDILTWDLRTSLQKELYQGRHNGNISVTLKPAGQNEEELIEINADEIASDKSLVATGTINEGLSVTFESKLDDIKVTVDCEPASK